MKYHTKNTNSLVSKYLWQLTFNVPDLKSVAEMQRLSIIIQDTAQLEKKAFSEPISFVGVWRVQRSSQIRIAQTPWKRAKRAINRLICTRSLVSNPLSLRKEVENVEMDNIILVSWPFHHKRNITPYLLLYTTCVVHIMNDSFMLNSFCKGEKLRVNKSSLGTHIWVLQFPYLIVNQGWLVG